MYLNRKIARNVEFANEFTVLNVKNKLVYAERVVDAAAQVNNNYFAQNVAHF